MYKKWYFKTNIDVDRIKISLANRDEVKSHGF